MSDESPGIGRHRSGRGFTYTDPSGSPLRDKPTLARIRSLAIPPAWTDVWICPIADGHLQATGRDLRQRKQYRYHPRWGAVRSETKYGRMVVFGNALPEVRSRVAGDLAATGFPKEKVLAVVVTLLEVTFIRVGNEEYARTNKSFGLTTMKDRHVEIDGSTLRFRFRGKSGKSHEIELADRRLARLVGRCRDLPGQDLFQYVAENGDAHPINSTDVNDYIRAISGQDFTAKDFRTWAGSLLAARELSTHVPADEAANKSALVAAVTAVAAQLGNTAAVCRKSYIHPAILEAFLDRAVHESWTKQNEAAAGPHGLDAEEAALLRFLAANQS